MEEPEPFKFLFKFMEPELAARTAPDGIRRNEGHRGRTTEFLVNDNLCRRLLELYEALVRDHLNQTTFESVNVDEVLKSGRDLAFKLEMIHTDVMRRQCTASR